MTTGMPQQALTLTATQRLARHYRLRHAGARRAAGETVCEPPPVWSWQAWLREQHARLTDAALAGRASPPPALLSRAQAQALWERIIRDSEPGAVLLQPPATAAAAHEAWVLARAWRLPEARLKAGDFPDVRAFAAWAAAYAAHCARESWLDEAGLADLVREALAEGRLQPPARIRLAGFDEFTPQQRELLAALAALGCHVEEADPPGGAGRVWRLACTDAAAEVRAAADWAAGRLRADPAARIGIVVLDLAARRGALARALDERLAPARRLDPDAAPAPYNLSLGQPLADIPLVHAALLALRGLGGRLDSTEAGALLRSPWLAGAQTERHARARLDARLRAGGRAWLGLGALGGLAARFRGCERLAEGLERARDLAAAWPQRQSPGAWAAALSTWLGALGWPHGRKLNSTEYQTLEAWQELLGAFAALGAVRASCTAAEAVAQLRRMARETLFQPRTPRAQVEVLGMLEAGGLVFDHLWVMGLSDHAWPPAPRPNPFLPVDWQREAGLPQASAARELALAETRTAGFRAAAGEVIFSWPQREGDAELRPSPLIASLPELESPEAAPPLARHWLAHRAREPLPETRLPPLPAGARVRGGTGLLADQAACAFRAAAVHRWRAAALERPAGGLDARARGSLVHRMLAEFWNRLGSRAALAGLDAAAREAVVRDCVAAATGDWCRRNPGVLEGRFRAVEERRLAALLWDWLELELARTEFEVEPAETAQSLEIGGLRLDARPDRMDRLPGGGRLVIDYKTGRLSTGDWLGERPEAPQLPLYALGNRAGLAGVLVARLRAGDLAYDGVTREPGLVPGVPGFTEWRNRPAECAAFEDLLEHWQRHLAALAEDFRSGRAPVNPKHPPGTCEHCHLGVLCRIDELRGPAQDLEEGGGDD